MTCTCGQSHDTYTSTELKTIEATCAGTDHDFAIAVSPYGETSLLFCRKCGTVRKLELSE